jgi:hypothetical protein
MEPEKFHCYYRKPHDTEVNMKVVAEKLKTHFGTERKYSILG